MINELENSFTSLIVQIKLFTRIVNIYDNDEFTSLIVQIKPP